jgi:hypothetical protein
MLYDCAGVTMDRAFGVLPALFACYAFLPTAALADVIDMQLGDTLQIGFASDPTAVPCPEGSCDVLAVNVVLSTPQPSVDFTVNFFSGTTLLGTTTDELFRSSTSLLQLGTIIDFTALQGPFSGIFDVTANEAISVDTARTNVDLGHADGPALFEFNPGTATINSIALTPEPRYSGIAGMLVCLAAASGFARSRRQRRVMHANGTTVI